MRLIAEICGRAVHQHLFRRAIVHVVTADDIVFAEVDAELYFDDFQRHFAGIFEPVPYSGGDVEGLILANEFVLFAAGNQRRSFHHHPMLRTMMVQKPICPMKCPRRPSVDSR